jgi:hypothetical protein
MVIDEVVCQQCGYEHAATVWDDDGWGALCGRCGWFSDAPLSESNEGGIETRTVQGNGAYCLAYGDGSDFCFGRTDGDVGGGTAASPNSGLRLSSAASGMIPTSTWASPMSPRRRGHRSRFSWVTSRWYTTRANWSAASDSPLAASLSATPSRWSEVGAFAAQVRLSSRLEASWLTAPVALYRCTCRGSAAVRIMVAGYENSRAFRI